MTASLHYPARLTGRLPSVPARVSAFCNPPDPLDQLCWTKSFRDQHGFDAGVQARAVLRLELQRGDDDDWNVSPGRFLLQSRDNLETVHFRHHEIEQDQVRFTLLQTLKRFPSVRGLLHD